MPSPLTANSIFLQRVISISVLILCPFDIREYSSIAKSYLFVQTFRKQNKFKNGLFPQMLIYSFSGGIYTASEAAKAWMIGFPNIAPTGKTLHQPLGKTTLERTKASLSLIEEPKTSARNLKILTSHGLILKKKTSRKLMKFILRNTIYVGFTTGARFIATALHLTHVPCCLARTSSR